MKLPGGPPPLNQFIAISATKPIAWRLVAFLSKGSSLESCFFDNPLDGQSQSFTVRRGEEGKKVRVTRWKRKAGRLISNSNYDV